MKLQNELNFLISKLNEIDDKIVLDYTKNLKESKNYKNFERRIAHDLLRYIYTSKGICNLYDTYNCNDTHIATLALKAFSQYKLYNEIMKL